MLQYVRKVYREETFEQRSQRMLPAAIYAALVAAVYTLTLALVNVYSFPILPLAVNWGHVFTMWIGMSFAFILFGALVGWFTEEYEGIVGGGIITTVVLLILSALISRAQPIISILPLLGATMLGALAARWVARRHNAILRESLDLRRKDLIKHVALVILIGLVPGILGRMDLASEQAILQLHRLLQAAPSDTSVLPQLPLKNVPALQNHFGVDYKIYARPSSRAVGTVEATVRFADGFVMTCNLPVGGGNRFITDCAEGNRPPN